MSESDLEAKRCADECQRAFDEGFAAGLIAQKYSPEVVKRIVMEADLARRYEMSETRIIEDGMELFRTPIGADVWFEDLGPNEWGFRVHVNPTPDEIKAHWSRTWPAPHDKEPVDGE